jgi:hypothetical protein
MVKSDVRRRLITIIKVSSKQSLQNKSPPHMKVAGIC